VVKLGFAVIVGVIDSPANNPVFPRLKIDIQAVDDANALDQPVLVAAILEADEFYFR